MMTVGISNQSLLFSNNKDFDSLNSISRVSHFERGKIIPQASDRVWLIKRGVVKTLSWNETGKTIILGYWGEGDIIGSLLSKVEPYEAQCVQDVEVVCLSWENCHNLLPAITYCLQQTDALLRIIRIEKMYNRLSQLLVLLGQKFGYKVLSGVLINIRLTHQELADLLGSTRVTVTRLLNQLEQEKIISRPGRFSIIIKDIEWLEKQY